MSSSKILADKIDIQSCVRKTDGTGGVGALDHRLNS
jgi:hypothetical protein